MFWLSVDWTSEGESLASLANTKSICWKCWKTLPDRAPQLKCYCRGTEGENSWKSIVRWWRRWL